MPTTVDNYLYKDIASALEANNPAQLHKYMYSQQYIPKEGGHPFGSILPLTEEFFGPKNLTLLILSKPYDMDAAILDAEVISKIKNNYSKWSTYKVFIWVDMVLALKMADEGDNEFYTKMEEFGAKVEGFANALKDHGVEYKGFLMDGKDAAFFQQFIDEFYAQEE